MIALIIPFMALAAAGFVISFVVHVLALAGVLPPGGDAVFVMHGGIFVIWLPAVLVSMRANNGQRNRHSWKTTLGGCPTWMRYACYVLFGYAILNFILAMGGAGIGQAEDGDLTPQTLRLFSGHWMVFYGVGFCILFSAFRKPSLLTTAKCEAGHKVAHSDNFCPTCGKAVAAASSRA